MHNPANKQTDKQINDTASITSLAELTVWLAIDIPLLSAMSFRRQLKTELYITAYYSH